MSCRPVSTGLLEYLYDMQAGFSKFDCSRTEQAMSHLIIAAISCWLCKSVLFSFSGGDVRMGCREQGSLELSWSVTSTVSIPLFPILKKQSS